MGATVLEIGNAEGAEVTQRTQRGRGWRSLDASRSNRSNSEVETAADLSPPPLSSLFRTHDSLLLRLRLRYEEYKLLRHGVPVCEQPLA